MVILFDPRTTRREQLKALSMAVKSAKTPKDRAAHLRSAKYRFAFILKRNHANLLVGERPLFRPLEHIEVISKMAKNWQKDFASIPLSEKDKEPLRLYTEELEGNPFVALENLLGLGYKVSILWSENSMSFIVSVIGTEDTKYNQTKVLSSFTDALEEAFFMAAYKHFILAEAGEWPTEKDNARWG